jgi:hypothetical protein
MADLVGRARRDKIGLRLASHRVEREMPRQALPPPSMRASLDFQENRFA